jgi:hypothetical protein
MVAITKLLAFVASISIHTALTAPIALTTTECPIATPTTATAPVHTAESQESAGHKERAVYVNVAYDTAVPNTMATPIDTSVPYKPIHGDTVIIESATTPVSNPMITAQPAPAPYPAPYQGSAKTAKSIPIGRDNHAAHRTPTLMPTSPVMSSATETSPSTPVESHPVMQSPLPQVRDVTTTNNGGNTFYDVISVLKNRVKKVKSLKMDAVEQSKKKLELFAKLEREMRERVMHQQKQKQQRQKEMKEKDVKAEMEKEMNEKDDKAKKEDKEKDEKVKMKIKAKEEDGGMEKEVKEKPKMEKDTKEKEEKAKKEKGMKEKDEKAKMEKEDNAKKENKFTAEEEKAKMEKDMKKREKMENEMKSKKENEKEEKAKMEEEKSKKEKDTKSDGSPSLE